MSNSQETIFIDNQLVDLNNLTVEKIQEFIDKLNEKLSEIRGKRNSVSLEGNADVLTELLNEEKEICSQIILLSSKSFDLKTSKKLEGIVDAKRSTVETLAASYGVSPEIAAEALKEYAANLGEVITAYKDGFTAATVAATQTHDQEIGDVIKLALKSKMDGAEIGSETAGELPYSIDDINAVTIDDVEADSARTTALLEHTATFSEKCNQTLGELSEEEKGLTTSEDKGNFLTRIFQKFTNKINGKEKFESNVVEPLEEKNKGIKKVIPFIKNMIKEELAQKLIEVCLLKKGAPIRAMAIEKITALMPMIESGAVTVASVLATSAAAQAITVAGLAAGAAIIAKVIYDKVKSKKEAQELQNEDVLMNSNLNGELNSEENGTLINIEPENECR